MAKVAVLGGLGYVGSRLCEVLLSAGYNVLAYDVGYYGNHLRMRPGLRVKIADIRSTETLLDALRGYDFVVNLASVSNDATWGIDENLSKSTNFDCFEPMVIAAKESGVKRFIYASTSSVYGPTLPGQDPPTEEHPFAPLTPYNDYKGRCEPLLFEHQSDDFITTVIRPATFCGYSPRMRLDLSVNILTHQAVVNRKIQVFGGSQMRPNIHIDDMCLLYKLLLECPAEKIQGQVFNTVHENSSIADLAVRVKDIVEAMIPGPPVEIVTTPSDDIRSYTVNADKVRSVLGFEPTLGVDQAIRDMVLAFEGGQIPNSTSDPRYRNVDTMKALRAA